MTDPDPWSTARAEYRALIDELAGEMDLDAGKADAVRRIHEPWSFTAAWEGDDARRVAEAVGVPRAVMADRWSECRHCGADIFPGHWMVDAPELGGWIHDTCRYDPSEETP